MEIKKQLKQIPDKNRSYKKDIETLLRAGVDVKVKLEDGYIVISEACNSKGVSVLTVETLPKTK